MSSESLCGFTQEKWLVDSVDKSICIEVEGGYINIASIGAVDVLIPAGDGLSAKFYYGPESVANAYLMRAAPEIFKALQGLVEHVRQSSPESESLPEMAAAKMAIESALMISPGNGVGADDVVEV